MHILLLTCYCSGDDLLHVMTGELSSFIKQEYSHIYQLYKDAWLPRQQVPATYAHPDGLRRPKQEINDGFGWLLNVLDCCTKFRFSFRMERKTAYTVQRLIPVTIHTGNGKEFVNQEMRALCTEYAICTCGEDRAILNRKWSTSIRH